MVCKFIRMCLQQKIKKYYAKASAFTAAFAMLHVIQCASQRQLLNEEWEKEKKKKFSRESFKSLLHCESQCMHIL